MSVANIYVTAVNPIAKISGLERDPIPVQKRPERRGHREEKLLIPLAGKVESRSASGSSRGAMNNRVATDIIIFC